MDRRSGISFSKYNTLWNTISLCRLIDNVNACVDNGPLHQRLFVCYFRYPKLKNSPNSRFSFLRLFVRLGEFDLSRRHEGVTPVDILIEQKIAHENYANNIISNDIGLLKLRSPAPVNGERINFTFFSTAKHQNEALIFVNK